MQSLNECLEKSNTTAGKLSEALGYIDELQARYARLLDAAREFVEVADYPSVHDAYCAYCDADVNQPHEVTCKYQIISDKLAAEIDSAEKGTE